MIHHQTLFVSSVNPIFHQCRRPCTIQPLSRTFLSQSRPTRLGRYRYRHVIHSCTTGSKPGTNEKQPHQASTPEPPSSSSQSIRSKETENPSKVQSKRRITFPSILLLIVGLLTSIPTLLLMIITLPLPNNIRPHAFLLRLFLRITLTLSLFRINRHNNQNLPTESSKSFFISNRQSTLDTFAIIASLPYAVRFIVPSRALSIPIIGTILKLSGLCVILPTDRRAALSTLSEPSSLPLLIFPEGKPGEQGKIGKFLSPPFKAALKLGVPIVPLSISGGWNICDGDVVPVRWGSIDIVVHQDIIQKEKDAGEGKAEAPPDKQITSAAFEAVNQGLPLQFQSQR